MDYESGIYGQVMPKKFHARILSEARVNPRLAWNEYKGTGVDQRSSLWPRGDSDGFS